MKKFDKLITLEEHPAICSEFGLKEGIQVLYSPLVDKYFINNLNKPQYNIKNFRQNIW